MQDRDLYRLFLHLCASLSFTRTAEDCHVSPATMSRAVRRLEAATGHRLLDRGPHGVALTEHGHRFRGYAAQALQLWESYRGDGLTSDQLSGSLRVFASVTACQSLLPDLLAPIRDTHPGVQISIRTGDAAAALAFLDDGEADLAVAALPSRVPATLLARPVAHTPLVLVRTRPSRSGTQPLALHEPFVLPRSGLVRDAANRWFRRIGATPHIAAEADGHEALLTWSPSATAPASFPTSSCATATPGPAAHRRRTLQPRRTQHRRVRPTCGPPPPAGRRSMGSRRT